jgi:CheY-like chemotaxis protein
MRRPVFPPALKGIAKVPSSRDVQPMTAPEPSPAPIVLVDDMEDDTFFAERLLQDADAEVPIIKFGSPIEAAESLDRDDLGPTRPLVWLVDVRMPNLSGFDIVTKIRARRELDDVPVVMLSGSDDPRDLEQAKRVGADCYLKKFPSVSEMQRVLECARGFRQNKSGAPDFDLPCNLLCTLAA